MRLRSIPVDRIAPVLAVALLAAAGPLRHLARTMSMSGRRSYPLSGAASLTAETGDSHLDYSVLRGVQSDSGSCALWEEPEPICFGRASGGKPCLLFTKRKAAYGRGYSLEAKEATHVSDRLRLAWNLMRRRGMGTCRRRV